VGSLSEAGLQKLRPVSQCSALANSMLFRLCNVVDTYSVEYWLENTPFDIQSASLSLFSQLYCFTPG